MNLAWLTDIHLNFLDIEERQQFYNKILNHNPDALLITGDIAEAPSIVDILNEMASVITKPIYFILGNHDYYRGKIKETRDELIALSKTNEHLFWLPASGIQKLDNHTLLLGQDGWADGRLGDYQNSTVELNDSRLIADLFQERILGKFHLLKKMQQLADEDATALQNNLLEAAIQQPKKIIILVHVPPFKEVSLYEGKISDVNWLPYFTSKITGEVLSNFANSHPDIECLVLCGHTHSAANYQPADNLIVKAGEAEYFHPVLQEIVSI